ncbi:hypothetical protein V1387_18210, partial [Allomuricauda taeanensis]|uniref:hypothetical protein n=1 Tax=Flagellimonas taeanensis TaxID=1005926 RepID=UPI002E7C0279
QANEESNRANRADQAPGSTSEPRPNMGGGQAEGSSARLTTGASVDDQSGPQNNTNDHVQSEQANEENNMANRAIEASVSSKNVDDIEAKTLSKTEKKEHRLEDHLEHRRLLNIIESKKIFNIKEVLKIIKSYEKVSKNFPDFQKIKADAEKLYNARYKKSRSEKLKIAFHLKKDTAKDISEEVRKDHHTWVVSDYIDDKFVDMFSEADSFGAKAINKLKNQITETKYVVSNKIERIQNKNFIGRFFYFLEKRQLKKDGKLLDAYSERIEEITDKFREANFLVSDVLKSYHADNLEVLIKRNALYKDGDDEIDYFKDLDFKLANASYKPEIERKKDLDFRDAGKLLNKCDKIIKETNVENEVYLQSLQAIKEYRKTYKPLNKKILDTLKKEGIRPLLIETHGTVVKNRLIGERIQVSQEKFNDSANLAAVEDLKIKLDAKQKEIADYIAKYNEKGFLGKLYHYRFKKGILGKREEIKGLDERCNELKNKIAEINTQYVKELNPSIKGTVAYMEINALNSIDSHVFRRLEYLLANPLHKKELEDRIEHRRHVQINKIEKFFYDKIIPIRKKDLPSVTGHWQVVTNRSEALTNPEVAVAATIDVRASKKDSVARPLPPLPPTGENGTQRNNIDSLPNEPGNRNGNVPTERSTLSARISDSSSRDSSSQLSERSLKYRGTVRLEPHAPASSSEGPNIDHTPPPQELDANEIIRRLNEPSKGKRLPSGFKSLF